MWQVGTSDTVKPASPLTNSAITSGGVARRLMGLHCLRPLLHSTATITRLSAVTSGWLPAPHSRDIAVLSLISSENTFSSTFLFVCLYFSLSPALPLSLCVYLSVSISLSRSSFNSHSHLRLHAVSHPSISPCLLLSVWLADSLICHTYSITLHNVLYTLYITYI